MSTRVQHEFAAYIDILMLADRPLTYIKLEWQDAEWANGVLESGTKRDQDSDTEDDVFDLGTPGT